MSNVEIAAAAGAPDNAIVSFRVSRGDLLIEVEHPLIKVQKRRFRCTAEGELYIFNEKLKKADSAPPLTGLRIFAAQVKAARMLGITRFVTFAQGDYRDKEYKGYLVWPLYGYDAPLTQRDQRLLPAHLQDAQSISDVIERGERDWWEHNGDARLMTFDLTEDSRSMKILTQRLQEKGLL